MKIKFFPKCGELCVFCGKLLCVSRETIVLVASYVPRETFFKLTTVCYLINERSLIRFLCVGKDPRIKSEDDILNLLDNSEFCHCEEQSDVAI